MIGFRVPEVKGSPMLSEYDSDEVHKLAGCRFVLLYEIVGQSAISIVALLPGYNTPVSD